MDVTVCVGTFGAPQWERLAAERAIPSVPPGVPVIHEHGPTLAKARNAALAKVETEFVVHLDADDELEPGYVEAMTAASADLRVPHLRQMKDGREWVAPFVPRVYAHLHDCTAECLRAGNWLVIGTCARAELLRSVGGWEEFGWSEDWAMWARAWMAGATIEVVPGAVYRAHWSRRGRNQVTAEEKARWHRTIEQAIWGEA